ncbi:PEP-CTERM sorting domain-containing protein [Stakelama sp. CBK3Z-3]|uniref:PEP-CTERM sorting domain-containing protein n=1 Tax=Stakelama flava TaxID=2860338 RepID=A0ABS6XM66_9SPHN|nr:DUF4886 domain-containing protein [Stakelama flava]MBW4331251.1 PEP-CTERM sorting domain-containing protein [Stakelama flava]
MRIGKAIIFAGAMFAAALPAQAQQSADARPQSVLFIGNSFTFGAHSAAKGYRAGTVEDLNRDGIGGVPALFKLFTREAGLDYRVSLETSPGRTLQWHWDNKRALVDRKWDHVVMQEYSVLDPEKPGNPAKLIDYSAKFARLFKAKNPDVDISLTATWTRPDQTFRTGGHWYGQSVYKMALDLERGYDRAAAADGAIDRVNPVGRAFNCAIQAGFADANPYDGIAFDQVDLWAWDHYHAGTPGYYLEALTVFISITGHDPRSFGGSEKAAEDLGLSPSEAIRLQNVAWANMHGGDCTTLAQQTATSAP